MMMETIGDISEQFFEWVSQTRQVSQQTLAALSDGRMLSGRQAHAVGLIDTCGGLYTALRVVSERLEVVETSLVWLNPQSPSMLARVMRIIKGIF